MAALMVIFFHYFIAINPTDHLLLLLKKIAVFGQTGVSLFFVLSGFLITRILLNSKEDSNYFINFFSRRSLRIFPLYFLFLIIYIFIVPIFIDNHNITSCWYYWVYLQNIAITFNWVINGPLHFWSLAVEEHFYMVWPFLVYFFNLRKIIISGFILIIITLLFRYFLTDANYETFYFTLTRMDDLVLGTFLAILEKKNLLNVLFKKRFAYAFLFLLLFNLVPWIFISHISHFWLQIFKYPMIATLYLALIGFLISEPTSKFDSIFKFSFLKYSGKISYGLYVYHPLVFLFGEYYFDFSNLFLKFFILVLFTFILSAFSFHFYENQFIKLKKYFI